MGSALLTALGIDISAPGLAQTPGRMARAYAELLGTLRDDGRSRASCAAPTGCRP